MKRILDRISILLFVGFIFLGMLLTIAFRYDDIIGELYENKDEFLNYKTACSTLGDAYQNQLFLHDELVNSYGIIQRALKKDCVWNNGPDSLIVVGSDGKLYSTSPSIPVSGDEGETPPSFPGLSEKMRAFSSYLKEQGIDPYFVQAPGRYNKKYVQLPDGVTLDESTVEAFFELLSADENLNLINTEHFFEEQKIPFDSLFFKTDHHWTIQTAFLVYAELCKSLNENSGFGIDDAYFDLNNWNVETVQECFLGSIGANVGEFFIGQDDFDFISPKFETDYIFTISESYNQPISSGGGITVEGPYSETVLDLEAAKQTDRVVYGCYIGSDRSEVVIKNLKSPTDKKVLVIKNSFGLPVSAFLSTCVSETRLLDLRYYKDSVKEYIEEYQPDAVILIYNPVAYKDLFFNFE